jgi:hypothetical protein
LNGLQGYFEFYNRERIHQSLNYQTPAAVYRQEPKRAAVTTFNRGWKLTAGGYGRKLLRRRRADALDLSKPDGPVRDRFVDAG